jgi:hypothetical protein
MRLLLGLGGPCGPLRGAGNGLLARPTPVSWAIRGRGGVTLDGGSGCRVKRHG